MEAKAYFALAVCVALLPCGALAKPPKNAGQHILPITVMINGTRQDVRPPPRLVKGQLLVPVRPILIALGLGFNKQGTHVTTYAGAKTITLTVGSTQAVIDGEPILLEAAPVEIQNVLYAPLRFFALALDAQAVYTPQTRSVDIVSTVVGRSGSGVVSQGGGVEEMGDVTAVDLDSSPPTVTIAYNASARTLPLNVDADVSVHDVNTGTSNPGDLSDVHPGDYADVFLDKAGHIKRIVDAFGSRAGKVAAAATGEIVLNDGHVIVPTSATTITLNGAAAPIGRLAVGDSVMVRYNIDSSEPREIIATRASSGQMPSASAAAITRIDVDPGRPLRRGDRVHVTMHATPGGLASFDIGPYVKNQSLNEYQPGLYAGSYSIPGGVNFADAPIFGHLHVRGIDAPQAESRALVSISTEPPGIVDFAPANGVLINNSRPGIYATFSSGVVPVNPSSAQLIVNGHDVTSESQRTARFIDYIPSVDYGPGEIRVTVRVADLAGNFATKTWSFFIRTR